jgi:uncharacterized protein YjbI with pentapeptide repeats
MSTNPCQNLFRFEEIISEINPVAVIRREPDEISQSNKLEFQESYDDLDYLVYAVFPLPSGNKVSLVRHLRSPEPGMEICVRYKQTNIPRVLTEAFSKMNLTRDDLTWIHPEYKRQVYELIDEQHKYELTIYNRKDLTGADLTEQALKRIILRKRDLRKAKFGRSELGMANLQEADLREADFQEADLREANLVGANLQGANLAGAYLQGADLQRANLVGANLQGADLQRANLKGADLTDAILNGASFRDADVEEAHLNNIRSDTKTMWFHVIGLHRAIGIPEDLKQQPHYKHWIALSEGVEELKKDNLREFKQRYKQVLAEIKNEDIAASLWNKIAWLSSLYGHGNSDDESYDAALEAVKLKGNQGNYHDTLGIVLALRKDFDSAIKEFEKALISKDVQNWAQDVKDRRKHWIESLRSQRFPFTKEELEVLQKVEY